jgi:hypothetical protein
MAERFAEFEQVERDIARLTTSLKGNGAPPPSSPQRDAMEEACRKAAAMIRDIHSVHASESETLAKHIEGIGANLNEMCLEMAKQIREMRAMPKEMAEQTAAELMKIGKQEAERHDRVSTGLLAARAAIKAIDEKREPVETKRPGDHDYADAR